MDVDQTQFMFEPYDAVGIEQCLRDWQSDQSDRRAARDALAKACSERRIAGVPDCETDLRRAIGLHLSLTRFAVREDVVVALDRSLQPPDTNGRRTLRVDYGRKGGAGRAWALAEWKVHDDQKLRCLTLQGMPGDLRAKLTGAFLHDIDGVCSDLMIYVGLAREAGLPGSDVAATSRYIAGRADWHWCPLNSQYRFLQV